MEILTKSKKLHEIRENLSAFHDGFFEGNPGRSDPMEIRYIRRWLDTLMFKCLHGTQQVYAEDASALVGVILDCEKEPFSQL